MRVSVAISPASSRASTSRSCSRASGATVSWIAQPAAVNPSTERRLSPSWVVRLTRPAATSRASARLTATLSIAVRSATSRADSASKRASTAITRHSVIDRSKRCW
jgi:hypothetical protein